MGVDAQALRVTGRAKRRPVLSLVVPAYNESEAIDRFLDRALPVLERLGQPFEIVFVDDGSQDDTLERLVAHHRRNGAIRVLSLSRNFGKEAALSAGLDHAAGQAVIPIDCDLQDPPELIDELVARWQEGYDVVVATRRSRQGEGRLKRYTAAAFYRLFNLLADRPIPADTGDFRLMDRRVVRVIRDMPERARFMKGIFAWVGFRQTAVHYEREPRAAGTTKWNYWKLWNFALLGLVSFSSVPLRIWSYAGAVCVALACCGGVLALGGLAVRGAGLVALAVMMIGGVQLLAIGVLGEYLARMVDELRARPLYLVSRSYGLARRRPAAARRRQKIEVGRENELRLEPSPTAIMEQPPAAA